VDVANELFAMAAAACRAQALLDQKRPEGREAVLLADVFCRMARRKIKQLFRELWSNDDVIRYKAALSVLDGRQTWMETGILEQGTAPPADAGSKAPAAEPRPNVAVSA